MVDRMSQNDEMSKGGQDHKREKVLQVEEKSHKGLNAQVDNMSQNNLILTTGQQLGEILHIERICIKNKKSIIAGQNLTGIHKCYI